LLSEKKGILMGVARFVRQFGPWNLHLQPTQDRQGLPDWLANWKGDGIIGRITDAATARLIRSTGLPFVDVRGGVRDRRIPLVRVDDAAVGQMAAKHLLERGFRYFAWFGPAGQDWAHDRCNAFAAAVREAGGQLQTYEDPGVVSGPKGWDLSEQQVAEWLAIYPKPAGILAANDAYGQRLLAAAHRAGLNVPEELAVLGVDDDAATCEVCDPPLSSVIIDSEQLGYKAAELLERLMRGARPPAEPLLIQPSGVRIRQSTDILAIDDPFIADAVRYIRENACQGIGVTDVLREIPLSRSVLQRRFRRIFGQTANQMIVDTRLKRAQQLLVDTDLPIARIAQMAGFHYQRYLGAVFQKRMKMTPYRFRRQAGPGRKLET
jgi:LacI family transcriptional regulator